MSPFFAKNPASAPEQGHMQFIEFYFEFHVINVTKNLNLIAFFLYLGELYIVPAEGRDYATCVAYSGAHYRTFDGLYYTFEGKCQYILAQAHDQSFTVFINNDDCDQNDCKRVWRPMLITLEYRNKLRRIWISFYIVYVANLK